MIATTATNDTAATTNTINLINETLQLELNTLMKIARARNAAAIMIAQHFESTHEPTRHENQLVKLAIQFTAKRFPPLELALKSILNPQPQPNQHTKSNAQAKTKANANANANANPNANADAHHSIATPADAPEVQLARTLAQQHHNTNACKHIDDMIANNNVDTAFIADTIYKYKPITLTSPTPIPPSTTPTAQPHPQPHNK